jgi:hypothetical protein
MNTGWIFVEDRLPEMIASSWLSPDEIKRETSEMVLVAYKINFQKNGEFDLEVTLARHVNEESSREKRRGWFNILNGSLDVIAWQPLPALPYKCGVVGCERFINTAEMCKEHAKEVGNYFDAKENYR